MFSRLKAGFLADWRDNSLGSAILRVLRISRILPHRTACRELLTNEACRLHTAAIASHDAFFYLSHRHYMARGLTAAQRVSVALHHYRHECRAFDVTYLDSVYRRGGLVLWREQVEGVDYEIRLQPGQTVLYEGGISVALFVDGHPTYVMSYCAVPKRMFVPCTSAPTDGSVGEASMLFVSRKQSTADHRYQPAFHKAFDRATAGHLCFGALAGIAMAQGHSVMFGIAGKAHPAVSPQREHQFGVAYDQFWLSLAGTPSLPFGYRIDLPMHLTSLDDLDAKARKRAIARRQHIAAVFSSAQAVIRERLLPAVTSSLASLGFALAI